MAFRHLAFLLVGFLSAANVADSVLASERVALVIGNSAYKNARALTNPKNDADDVSRTFEALGFTVIKGLDLDKRSMEAVLQRFASALGDANVGVFFYAGHGLQVAGHNYMVPIDARLTNAHSVDFELIRLDLVHRTMERATNTNILFVDACRDNPLARNLARAMGTRSSAIGHGLAPMEAGVGTLISFSTQPGNVALDGTGKRNSPYAEALVRHVSAARHNIADLLIHVRRDVMRETKLKQVPWEHSALTDQFYFKPRTTAATTDVGGDMVPRKAMSSDQVELLFWGSVKDSEDPDIIRTYIQRYPSGIFSSLAKVLVEKLEKRAEKETIALIKQEELKAAEQKQRRAEVARREAERKAFLARHAEELRKARAEAERARKALAEAEVERAQALNAAKEAQLAKERAKNEAKQLAETQVTSLQLSPSGQSVPTKKADRGSAQSNPDDKKLDQSQLTRAVQRELRRLGCYQGGIDGDWGPRSRRGAARALGVKALEKKPNHALFARLKKLEVSACSETIRALPKLDIERRRNANVTTRERASPKRHTKKRCLTYTQCIRKCRGSDRSGYCAQDCSGTGSRTPSNLCR